MAVPVAIVVAWAIHVRPAAVAQAPGGVPSQIDRLLKTADEAIPAGRFDEMARASEQAVDLSRSIADAARLGESLFRLGQARFYQSRNDAALDCHTQVVEIATRLGNAPLRARGLNGVGLALRELGEYDQAIEYMTQALTAHRAGRNRVEEVRVQRNIAVLYWQLGDLRRAESTIRAASALARAIGNKPFESITLQALGGIVADGGRPREALAIDRQALAIAQDLKMPALLIDLGVTTGQALDAVGDHERALEMYRTTLAESERAGYRAGEAVAMGHIGATYLQLGRPDEALPWVLGARALFAGLGTTTHLGNVIANEFTAGRAQRDLERPDEALATFRTAIDMVDRMRAAAVPTEGATASVNAARTDVFLETAGLLTDLGRSREAFEISERYHARAFLDVLAASRVDLRQDTASERRERALLARAAALQNQLWSADLTAERRRALGAELAAVDDEFERMAGAGRRGRPGYAVQNPDLLDVSGVQQRLAGDRTVLLEYMLGTSRSFVWAVSRDRVESATLPGRDAIEPMVARYRKVLSARVSPLTLARSMREYERAASALYATVLAPVESSLQGARRLIVVTDGALAYVPLETLRRGGAASQPGLVLDRFDVSYAPSASALSAMAAAPLDSAAPARTLFAVGDPLYEPTASPPSPSASAFAEAPADRSARQATASRNTRGSYARAGVPLSPLPSTRAEVEAIGALVPSSQRTVLVGATAREDRIKAARLADFRYLHFATHGLLDPVNPARSGLVLAYAPRSADDGVLQMREIMRLKLNADLVTLSACETGLGRVLNGEGVMGLTRAFVYAGARSVVVSLWDVSDTATADLMRRFYTELKRGQPRDAALAASKRALAHGPKRLWRHPYFWAPFVFTGAAQETEVGNRQK